MENFKELNRKDVYDKTVKIRKEKAKKDLEVIKNKIDKAVEEGEMGVYLHDITIDNISVEELRSRGFRVHLFSGDIDDYGNFYQGFIKISWKPTLWDKIVKIFFKGSR